MHDLAFMDDAACKDISMDVFFPDRHKNSGLAKKICAGCPVQQECLDYALKTTPRFGIWGGYSVKELRALNRA